VSEYVNPFDAIRDDYHGYVQEVGLGFWTYHITGHGISKYSMGQPSSRLPRRSKAAALAAMGRRADRLRKGDRKFRAQSQVTLKPKETT
jgi:monoamine oxidase